MSRVTIESSASNRHPRAARGLTCTRQQKWNPKTPTSATPSGDMSSLGDTDKSSTNKNVNTCEFCGKLFPSASSLKVTTFHAWRHRHLVRSPHQMSMSPNFIPNLVYSNHISTLSLSISISISLSLSLSLFLYLIVIMLNLF
eukprot:sb/3474175/